MINKILKTNICNFFNKEGWVLNFSTYSFNKFTEEVVGIPIMDWAERINGYSLSKGKSFDLFILKQSDYMIYTLVLALVEYMRGGKYLDNKPFTDEEINKAEELLKEVEEACLDSALMNSTENLKLHFNSEYIEKKIDEMVNLQKTDSREAIGKSKELLESTFKYVLESEGIEYSNKDNVMVLRKKCFKTLNLESSENKFAQKDNNVKQILSGLTQIINGMNLLRNIYGSGHGISPNGYVLPARYGELTVNSAITITKFIIDTYKEKEKGYMG